ncbi:hypothetical protein PhCBS80983_g06477 [Powellomyces hirtus]|uniref:Uncharacterized protein n=1 Tax=Powellomyces hirtus TaxID=109895 RepID=A0A507DNQ0_9FUNG|nr:hypothetical protein PhCBS80983_g06477 [Powellomyces hirtus]
MHSDAMSENIAVYRPIKETFDSRAAANPTKIVIDSNSSFSRPQRSYLSARVALYNQDGSLFKTANLSQTGVMSIFKSVNLKLGGKVVDNIKDYAMLVMDNYATSSVAEKKMLKYNEAYSRPDAFQNDNASFTFKHFLLLLTMRPTQGQPLPLCVLPNQAVEVTLMLNNMQQAFTNFPAGGYCIVDQVRYVAQLVTPSAEYLSTLWKGIQGGKFL